MKKIVVLVCHNIKSPALEDYRDFKGWPLEEFRRQVDFLCAKYEPLSEEDVIRGAEDGSKLPSKGFLVTFDDGYKDQLIAAEELRSRKLSGVFYINTLKLEGKRLITVDKQRFMMYASGKNMTGYFRDFYAAIKEMFPEAYGSRCEPTPENIREASGYLSTYAFYSDEEKFYRKVRDKYLTEEQYRQIVERLFPKYFSDEAALVEKYFMNWKDVRDIISCGMAIGAHTHSHPYLERLDRVLQKAEVLRCMELIKKKTGVKARSIAYPYESMNAETVNVVKEAGISIGFVGGEKPNEGLKDRYRLNRIGPEAFSRLMEEAPVK